MEVLLFCVRLSASQLLARRSVPLASVFVARASQRQSRFTKSQASLPDFYACFCVYEAKRLVFPVA